MKLNTDTIEGYASMTPEQKIAALEALELPAPDLSGYVQKAVFDRTASELAAVKKKYTETLSTEQQAKLARDQELEDMGIDSSSVEFNAPQTYEEFLNQNPGKGTLKIQAFTARQALPVPGVHIIVSKRIGDDQPKTVFRSARQGNQVGAAQRNAETENTGRCVGNDAG